MASSISRGRVGSGTFASEAWRTIGASVPSMSSSTAARAGSARSGSSSSAICQLRAHRRKYCAQRARTARRGERPAARSPAGTRRRVAQLRYALAMGLDNPVHILILLLVVLLVFGAKRLPEIGRSLGEGMRGFKDSISGQPNQQTSLTVTPAQAPPAPAPAPVPVAAPVPGRSSCRLRTRARRPLLS